MEGNVSGRDVSAWDAFHIKKMNRKNSNFGIAYHRKSVSMSGLPVWNSPDTVDFGVGTFGSASAVPASQWWRNIKKWGVFPCILVLILFLVHMDNHRDQAPAIGHGEYVKNPPATVVSDPEMSVDILCKDRWKGAYPLGGFKDSADTTVFNFVTVADLDGFSKTTDGDEHSWVSYMLKGELTYNKANNKYTVTHEEQHQEIYGYHSLRDRGMELSELTTYNGLILAVDDRTGILYQLLHEAEESPGVVPYALLHVGDGKQVSPSRGFKGEWMTVKDKKLYVGSVGKPFIKAGVAQNMDNMWIKVVDCSGAVSHQNWSMHYTKILKDLGYEEGYMVHEAVVWNPTLQQWLFMPRRASRLPYDSDTEPIMGTNLLISADEHFDVISVEKAGESDPTLGCSTMKIIPNTEDRHLVVVKTKEVGCHEGGTEIMLDDTCITESYISVVDVHGTVLMPSTLLAGYKIEGFEFF